MTAVSREMFEEFIGIKMLELARSEGHFPNFPNNDKRAIEKQQRTRMERCNGTALTDRYQKAVHYAIKKGITNVRSISEATGIEEDAVRRACRQLCERGKIKRAGIVRKPGCNAQIWELVTP
jgi:predicted HTH transcriptional regulator